MLTSKEGPVQSGHAPEVGIILHLGISNLQDQIAATSEGELSNDWIKHCVNVLRQVLHEQGLSILDGADHLLM